MGRKHTQVSATSWLGTACGSQRTATTELRDSGQVPEVLGAQSPHPTCRWGKHLNMCVPCRRFTCEVT